MTTAPETSPEGAAEATPLVDEPSTATNIHEAIFAIKSEIPMLAKDGTVQLGSNKVKILQIDDILKAIKPLYIKHGVSHYDTLVEDRTEYQLAGPAFTMEGKPAGDGRVPSVRAVVRVTYDYRFVHVASGTEVTVRFVGEAFDTQDKATRKATTSAWKICQIQTFDIITGEPDGETEAAPGDSKAVAEEPQTRQRQMSSRAKEPAKPAATPAAAEAPAAEEKPEAEQKPASTKPSVTTDPRAALKTPPEDVPAPAAEQVDKLDAIKARARKAIDGLGIPRTQVDEIGKSITGQERQKWINSIPLAGKVATELERLLAVKLEAESTQPSVDAPADARGDEDPNAGDKL